MDTVHIHAYASGVFRVVFCKCSSNTFYDIPNWELFCGNHTIWLSYLNSMNINKPITAYHRYIPQLLPDNYIDTRSSSQDIDSGCDYIGDVWIYRYLQDFLKLWHHKSMSLQKRLLSAWLLYGFTPRYDQNFEWFSLTALCDMQDLN